MFADPSLHPLGDDWSRAILRVPEVSARVGSGVAQRGGAINLNGRVMLYTPGSFRYGDTVRSRGRPAARPDARPRNGLRAGSSTLAAHRGCWRRSRPPVGNA